MRLAVLIETEIIMKVAEFFIIVIFRYTIDILRSTFRNYIFLVYIVCIETYTLTYIYNI